MLSCFEKVSLFLQYFYENKYNPFGYYDSTDKQYFFSKCNYVSFEVARIILPGIHRLDFTYCRRFLFRSNDPPVG